MKRPQNPVKKHTRVAIEQKEPRVAIYTPIPPFPSFSLFPQRAEVTSRAKKKHFFFFFNLEASVLDRSRDVLVTGAPSRSPPIAGSAAVAVRRKQHSLPELGTLLGSHRRIRVSPPCLGFGRSEVLVRLFTAFIGVYALEVDLRMTWLICRFAPFRMPRFCSSRWIDSC